MVRLAALDLEMEQPSREIIQIGIAWENVDTLQIETKSFFITPSEPVSDFISELTGITDHDFDWQKPRDYCFAEFSNFWHEHVRPKVFDSTLTWGSGDIQTLRSQMKKHVGTISSKYMNVKDIYNYREMIRGRNPSNKVSLKSAIANRKMKFEGRAHDAANDAKMTLELFRNMYHNDRDMYENIQEMKLYN